MFRLVKTTLYVFLGIVALTALLVLSGVARLWFLGETGTLRDLPYLGWLLPALIGEVVVVVLVIARKGLKYQPDVVNHKGADDTLFFMRDLVASGSTVQIVSGRFSWGKKSPELFDEIMRTAKEGTLVEVITPNPVADDIRTDLENAGVRFFVTHENVPPEARFTLINGNRSGAERLAIAKGSYPQFEVTIFNNDSGPQIIGMAKDIIRKSKEIANAQEMG